MENGIRFLFGGVAGCIGVRDERVFEFMLHGLVTAFCDNNGFGEAVLGAAAVGMNKELDEAEASLQRCSAIAKSALDTVPEAKVPMHERDNADAHDALAWRAAFALPEKNAEVENGNGNVEEGLRDFAVGELYELRITDLEVEWEAGVDLLEAGERMSLSGPNPQLNRKKKQRDDGPDNDEKYGKDAAIDHQGQGALLKAGQLDAIQLQQPFRFASREIAHTRV